MTIITITGNIACGKSTILSKLKKENPSFLVKKEPLEEWKPYLDAFYNDPQRNSLNLQLKVLSSFDTIKTNFVESGKNILIVERSPFDSLNVFAKTLVKEKNMTMSEFETLDALHETTWKPDFVVYLRSTPSVCMQRLQSRSRDNEQTIELQYLSQIHSEYDNAYYNCPVSSVIVVDADEDEEFVYDQVKKHMKQFSLNMYR